MDARRNPRLAWIIVPAGLAGLLPVVLAADGRTRLEAGAALLLLAAILLARPVRLMLAAWTDRQRAILLLLAALLVFGQLAGADRWTFPFVRWEMYARAPGEAVFEVGGVRAVVAAGGTVPISLRALYGHLGWRIEAALRRQDLIRPDAEARAILRWIGAELRRARPELDVVAMERTRTRRTVLPDGNAESPRVLRRVLLERR